MLQAAIRTLSKLVPHCPSEALSAGLPAVLPGLFVAFNNSNADVRKAVVFCLVDIYMVLGPVRDTPLSFLLESTLTAAMSGRRW